jgi:hypothetical protein
MKAAVIKQPWKCSAELSLKDDAGTISSMVPDLVIIAWSWSQPVPVNRRSAL